MKLKICIIIICLIVFGCKSKQEPVYITRIGQLTPGNGGTPHLEVLVDSVEDKYEIYELHFYEVHETYEGWGGGNYYTHPFGETVKIIGEEANYWYVIPSPPYTEKVYRLCIRVKSMEVIEPEE